MVLIESQRPFRVHGFTFLVRWIFASAMVIFCLGITNARGADSPDVATLKAAGGNVYAIKKEDGGGTGVSFQNFNLDEKGWHALESLPNLKTVTISGTGKAFGNEQMARLCQIKSIESMFVNGFGGTEDGFAALGKLPNLRHFGADHSPFTGTGLIALKDSKNFTSLRFGGCPFDDNGMKGAGRTHPTQGSQHFPRALHQRGFWLPRKTRQS